MMRSLSFRSRCGIAAVRIFVGYLKKAIKDASSTRRVNKCISYLAGVEVDVAPASAATLNEASKSSSRLAISSTGTQGDSVSVRSSYR